MDKTNEIKGIYDTIKNLPEEGPLELTALSANIEAVLAEGELPENAAPLLAFLLERFQTGRDDLIRVTLGKSMIQEALGDLRRGPVEATASDLKFAVAGIEEALVAAA